MVRLEFVFREGENYGTDELICKTEIETQM